jgi:hypothetical protein
MWPRFMTCAYIMFGNLLILISIFKFYFVNITIYNIK